MASNLKWHGEAIKKKFDSELKRRITAGTILVLGHARKLISIEGTTVLYRMTKSGKYKQAKRLYNTSPSAPGEPPHKQTGHLRRSVAREIVGLIGRVGTNLNYGRWLELGTKKMAARPWLRRAFNEKLAEIRALLSRPLH